MTSNAALARRWFNEVWVAGGEETVNELMDQQSVGYMEGVDIDGRDQFQIARRELLRIFPDLAITADDVIADGDKVAVRWHVHATHSGNGFGLVATNRRVSFRGLTWLEFKHHKIVRGWDSWNMGAMIESLKTP